MMYNAVSTVVIKREICCLYHRFLEGKKKKKEASSM